MNREDTWMRTETGPENEPAARAIGVFDSGVGGLTVMRALMKTMPMEDIVYFGDTARVPYGSKSKETIVRFSRQIVSFLRSRSVKAIVVACNTASAYALEELRGEFELPIVGVIAPGAAAAVSATRNGKIGVIGTYATVESQAYDRAIRALDPALTPIKTACPLFVPLVEEGLTSGEITDRVVAYYLSRMKAGGVDTLLLGCTHYPLMKGAIAAFMGEGVRCIDPAKNTAEELRGILESAGLLRGGADVPVKAEYTFAVSDAEERMTAFANRILPFSIAAAEKIAIESYEPIPHGSFNEERGTLR